jgi:protein-tyrosine phosphatase
LIHVCFVCLGNICRSPTAEGIFANLVARADLSAEIAADSAGTAAYHVGNPPDPRSIVTARARGIELVSHARQFRASDYERFDYVIAMDRENHGDLAALASPKRIRDKLRLLREFESLGGGAARDVPDPYYGGDDGFDRVFDICVDGCRGLLDYIAAEHTLSRIDEFHSNR